MITLPYRQRNDDRRTVGLGSTRGRHIPADGRQETVSNHRHCRGYGLGLFQFSLRGGSSPGLREGDRRIPSKRSVATLNTRGGPVGVRFAGAPHYRLLNPHLQIKANAVQSHCADLPKHPSGPFVVAAFDAANQPRDGGRNLGNSNQTRAS